MVLYPQQDDWQGETLHTLVSDSLQFSQDLTATGRMESAVTASCVIVLMEPPGTETLTKTLALAGVAALGPEDERLYELL